MSKTSGSWILEDGEKMSIDDIMYVLPLNKHLKLYLDCSHSSLWVDKARELYQKNKISTLESLVIYGFCDKDKKLDYGAVKTLFDLYNQKGKPFGE